ncbi:MAG: RNA polymerase sigma factor [Deltaproteobacteria bacterium]|nr:RNA polymerase sigma factor [Deltaproteobacteria bacterium]
MADGQGSAQEGLRLEAARAGDERAFLELVTQHQRSMVGLARAIVGRDEAEDVVQEAWLAALQGAAAFQGRGSLRSWLLSIVANRSRTLAARSRRQVSFDGMAGGEAGGPSVEAERFRPPSDPDWPGHWVTPPAAWPEARLAAAEVAREARRTIEKLPPGQRAVITLRDVEGLDPEETCRALQISEANQRVLLHRARVAVRRALEAHMLSAGVGA